MQFFITNEQFPGNYKGISKEKKQPQKKEGKRKEGNLISGISPEELHPPSRLCLTSILLLGIATMDTQVEAPTKGKPL